MNIDRKGQKVPDDENIDINKIAQGNRPKGGTNTANTTAKQHKDKEAMRLVPEKAKRIQGQNESKNTDAKRHMIEKAKIEALIEKHRLRTPKTPDEVNKSGTGKNAIEKGQEGTNKGKPQYKKATKDIQIKKSRKKGTEATNAEIGKMDTLLGDLVANTATGITNRKEKRQRDKIDIDDIGIFEFIFMGLPEPPELEGIDFPLKSKEKAFKQIYEILQVLNAYLIDNPQQHIHCMSPDNEYVLLIMYANTIEIDLCNFPAIWAVFSILLDTQSNRLQHVKSLQQVVNNYYDNRLTDVMSKLEQQASIIMKAMYDSVNNEHSDSVSGDIDRVSGAVDSNHDVNDYDKDKNEMPYDKDGNVMPYDKDENEMPNDKDENEMPYDKDENEMPYDKDEYVMPNEKEKYETPHDSDNDYMSDDNDDDEMPIKDDNDSETVTDKMKPVDKMNSYE